MGTSTETLAPNERDEAAMTAGRGMSRRQMIKAAGLAGVAAWTAPVIVDSLTSPVAAFTAPPCPDVAGNYYAVVWQPDDELLDRLPLGDGFGQVVFDSCTNLAIPLVGSGSPCRVAIGPLPGGYQRTFIDSIQLTVEGVNPLVNINHNVTVQNNGTDMAVRVKLADTSCCQITGVRAFVHKFQAASQGVDCPAEYCQQATLATGATTPATAYLLYQQNSPKEWLVWPNENAALCPTVGVHWGSPNRDDDCTGADDQAQPHGQSHGYMLITLSCNPGFVPQP